MNLGLFRKKPGEKRVLMNLFSKGSAAMAEWSNAPVWKAGLLTEARVRISFGSPYFLSKADTNIRTMDA